MMMIMRASVLSVLIVVLGLVTTGQCAVFEGSVSGSRVLYIGKFAYDYNSPGDGPVGKWGFTGTPSVDGSYLAMFDDQSGSWPAAYEDSCDCQCAIQRAISTYSLVTGSSNAYSGEITEHIRPRFWFAAIVSCDSVKVDYHITFEQEDGSQVGVNDEGLFAMYMTFFFVWGIGLVAQLWASRWLWRTRTFHPIVKLFCLAMVFWFLFIFCLMIHWAVYDSNGEGVPFMQGLGHVFEVFARVTFLLLVMLIATGWTISTTVLRHRLQILIAIGIILIVYLILAIWDLAGRNPATTDYLYDSAPGIIIVVLHIVFCGWFVWRIRQTAKDEVHTEKLRFYKWFGLLYGLWFFLLPLVVLIGSVVARYDRVKVVMTTLMILNTIAVSVLGFMLWPSRAARYFEIQTDQFIGSTQQYEDL